MMVIKHIDILKIKYKIQLVYPDKKKWIDPYENYDGVVSFD